MGADSTFIERSKLKDAVEAAGFALPLAAVKVPAEHELADIVEALVELELIELEE